jgi:ABC-type polysaccharide/polyol phosphate export permease
MAVGYFWSILAMVSMPFLLLGIVGTVIARQLKRDRR